MCTPFLYSKKNHTHVEKWGTPQNLFLTFTDELEKQILRKLLTWAQKTILIFTRHFFKKNKSTCKYHYFTPVYLKS